MRKTDEQLTDKRKCTSVPYKKNVIILKTNGTILNFKKSVAYRHCLNGDFQFRA